jgi:V8-like Glu-specific endopeptidase
MGPRWGVVLAAALLAAAVWCAPASAIVGGTTVSISNHPYQVALIHGNTAADDPAGQYCGGTIRDSTHVITAAHCVFNLDGSGQPAQPDEIQVLAGTADLSDEGAGHRVQVERVSFEPDYSAKQFTYDAALLTLAEPLDLEPNSEMEATQIVDDSDWQAVDTGASVFVTGWGATQYNGQTQSTLRGVSVKYYTPQDCEDNPSFIVDLAPGQICAASPGKDACQGDSGGPLVLRYSLMTPADDRLVGIVSSGVGCASSTFPGIYTEAAFPPIRAFLEQADPPAAPSLQAAPVLSGRATVGDQLTCSPGAWSGSPSFTYQFVRSVQSRDVGVAAAGSSPQYTITGADLGAMLRCDVRAANSGGSALASSAPTAAVAAAPSTPPSTTPSPPVQQSQTNLDLNAPVARITKVSCTVTRCTLSVSVSDAGFSAGIRTVQATVRSTYRSTCKRHGRKVACTKHKTRKLSVKALSATRFRVVASKLPVGKQLFTLVAVDKAGHRQALPTRKTVTTKKKKATRR